MAVAVAAVAWVATMITENRPIPVGVGVGVGVGADAAADPEVEKGDTERPENPTLPYPALPCLPALPPFDDYRLSCQVPWLLADSIE